MFSRVIIREFPASLASFYGVTTSVGGDLTSVKRAYEALKSVAPDLSQEQYAHLLGQAKAETDFGDAFETPDGSSSNNWGAIYAAGDLGTLTRYDKTPDGKTIEVKAAWNSSPEVGARQFYNLIRDSYKPALDRAAAGDLWGYSAALWRNGPCPFQTGTCKRPAYYVGFPPGHKWGAPSGVELYSDADEWYRITAYAKFIAGGINAVNKALGWSSTYSIDPPPNPDGDGFGVGSVLLIGAVAAGGYGLWRLGGLGAARRLIGGM
jgi:hypothetical protein